MYTTRLYNVIFIIPKKQRFLFPIISLLYIISFILKNIITGLWILAKLKKKLNKCVTNLSLREIKTKTGIDVH